MFTMISYINQGTLDQLVLKTTQLSKQISSLMSYLKNSEYKGSKFHEPEN